ncbi:MAG: sugar phosphate nucleotidyltransferase [Promethearchaeia archaeon]
MEKPLLQHGNNNPFQDTVFILLCAGKGTRLRTITKNIPKSLIRLKQIGNKPILQYTIENLLLLSPRQIIVITGYLCQKIDDFLANFEKTHQSVKDKVSTFHASKRFELGPLYSFISISNSKKYFSEDYNYCVLPGDTIFDFSKFQSIQEPLRAHIQNEPELPLVFYRKIISTRLVQELDGKERPGPRKIVSISEYWGKGRDLVYLKQIKKKEIQGCSKEQIVNQIIPLFYLSYEFIIKIQKSMPEYAASRLTEMINMLIENQDEKIKAVEIPTDFRFYDIDTKQDLKRVDFSEE